MYQAETPVGLCKYKDNEKGKMTVCGFSVKVKVITLCVKCK